MRSFSQGGPYRPNDTLWAVAIGYYDVCPSRNDRLSFSPKPNFLFSSDRYRDFGEAAASPCSGTRGTVSLRLDGIPRGKW